MNHDDLVTRRAAFVVGVFLIVVVLVGEFAGTRILSANQEASAVEVNLAGRLRMPSQRIALTPTFGRNQ